MVRSKEDGFDPYWMDERDWLVDVVHMDSDGLDADETEYIGRLFAFSVATDTRMLAQVAGPQVPGYELWFSFRSERQKQEFLQMVRNDGYANPDDECCFDSPETLEDLKDLRPIILVFPKEQSDHIVAVATVTSMGIGSEPDLN